MMRHVAIALLVLFVIGATAEKQVHLHGIADADDRSLEKEELKTHIELLNPEVTDEQFDAYWEALGESIHHDAFQQATSKLLSSTANAHPLEESELVEDEDDDFVGKNDDLVDQAYNLGFAVEDAFDDAEAMIEDGDYDDEEDKFWRRAKAWLSRKKTEAKAKFDSMANKFKETLKKAPAAWKKYSAYAKHHFNNLKNKASNWSKVAWNKIKSWGEILKTAAKELAPQVYKRLQALLGSLKNKFEEMAYKAKWYWRILKSMRFFPKLSMPVHGNWCGPGYGQKKECAKKGNCKPTIDAADACCKLHDFCYEASKTYFACCCERAMYACQARAIASQCDKNPGKSAANCKQAAKFVYFGFNKLTPCKCGSSWKMPSSSGTKCSGHILAGCK